MKTLVAAFGTLMALSSRSGAQAPDVAPDSTLAPSGSIARLSPAGVTRAIAAPTDTVRRRPRAIDVSDAYALRLRIHHYASYSTIPLFLAQSIAGNQLLQADRAGGPRPGWAKSVHSLGALGLGGLFTVNTVTGLWNLWESRDNEVGRTKRLLHSTLMLASDAGFAYTGLVLAGDAKRGTLTGRDNHTKYAYYSMGAALAGYGVMLVGDH